MLLNAELKWYSYKVEIITREFFLNNGIIAYVRNVLISLIEKVTGCSCNHLMNAELVSAHILSLTCEV